jgi:hypothetical protein
VIGIVQDTGYVSPPSATYGGGDFHGLTLARTKPTPIGRELYRLMRLDCIPAPERDAVLAELAGRLQDRLQEPSSVACRGNEKPA